MVDHLHFFHISPFTRSLRRLRLNDLLVYSIEYDKRGRAQDSGISFLIPAPSKHSESKLHLVALLGGWPGGFIARHKLRHKTIKQPFRFIFWCTVVLNCLGLGFTSLSICGEQ